MGKIEDIVERFASELRDSFGEKILGIYLFGSVFKGTDTEESDIDILVVYSNLDEETFLKKQVKSVSELSVRRGELLKQSLCPKRNLNTLWAGLPFFGKF